MVVLRPVMLGLVHTVTPYFHPIGGRPPDSAAHPRQAHYPICCSHIQRREGRPTRRKPGCKSPRWARETWSDPSRGASNLTGRSKREPVKPRKPGPARNGLRDYWECRAARISAKAASASRHWTYAMSELPGVREDGMSGRNGSESPEPLVGRLGAPAQRRHRV